MASITVTDFKANCLTLLSEAESTFSKVTITKRGRAVATFGAVGKPRGPKLSNRWAGWVDVPETVEDFDISHHYKNERSF